LLAGQRRQLEKWNFQPEITLSAPSVGHTRKNISAPLNPQKPFSSSKNEFQQCSNFWYQKFT
jgi:hypothetical protein